MKTQTPARNCTTKIHNPDIIEAIDLQTPLINFEGGELAHTNLLFMSANDLPTAQLPTPASPRSSLTDHWPNQKLPLETLQHIFSYMVPPQTIWSFDTPWPLPKRSDVPFTLRRVCRAWAEVAFAHPLWSSVAWSVCIPNRPDSKARLAWISSFSEITKEVPIDHFSYKIGSAPLTPDSWTMMGAVSRLIPNCRALQVVLPDWYAPDLDDTPTHSDLLTNMPHLRALSWTSPHDIETTLPVGWRLPWTKLSSAPWEQLTSLSLACPLTIYDCVDILGWCPELETVEFDGVFEAIHADANVHHTPALHHTLRSLKVCSFTDVNMLFRKVTFANLDNLHLHLSYCATRLQDLCLSWDQLKTLVLECPLELVDAYQMFRQCHMVTKIEWRWPSDMECPLPGNELLRSLPLDLPLLDSLIITPSLPYYYVKHLVNLLISQKTRRLASFFAPSLPAKLLHFEHLTSIVLTSTPISLHECSSIIAASNILQHLDVIVSEGGPADDLNTITSGLTSLTIRTMLQNLQPLLDCLVLPSLASLQLLSQPHEDGPTSFMSEVDWTGTRNYSNGPEQKGIREFLMRSMFGNTLRNLTFQDIDIEEEEMGHILQMTADCKTDTHIKANIINYRTNISHSLIISRAY